LQLGDEFNKASRPHPSHAIATTNFRHLFGVCVCGCICVRKAKTNATHKQTDKQYISIAADNDYYYYCSPCFSPSLAVSHSPPSPVLFFFGVTQLTWRRFEPSATEKRKSLEKTATNVNRRRLSPLFSSHPHTGKCMPLLNVNFLFHIDNWERRQ